MREVPLQVVLKVALERSQLCLNQVSKLLIKTVLGSSAKQYIYGISCAGVNRTLLKRKVQHRS